MESKKDKERITLFEMLAEEVDKSSNNDRLTRKPDGQTVPDH